MPFLAYVHSHEPDPPPEPGQGKRPWEPNWRFWGWVVAAVVACYCAARADGIAGFALIVVAFSAACRAIDVALPRGDGLREWRQ